MTSMIGEFDIAIVGMSGRFPGARNVDAFWHNLAGGIESITRFSDQEILESGVPASCLNSPSYVKAAPILEEPDNFDAAFFGFSPMEARTMASSISREVGPSSSPARSTRPQRS